MELRPVSSRDLDFLIEMTLLAAFPPGSLPDAAPDLPHAKRWFDDWGRPADRGVVAWHDGRRLGAAWCRLQERVLVRDPAGQPVPELAIAVVPDHRAGGVGTRLLAELVRTAARADYSALSLTVNAANPAVRLYERSGFDLVRRDGDRLTMVKWLMGDTVRQIGRASCRERV